MWPVFDIFKAREEDRIEHRGAELADATTDVGRVVAAVRFPIDDRRCGYRYPLASVRVSDLAVDRPGVAGLHHRSIHRVSHELDVDHAVLVRRMLRCESCRAA